MKVRQPSSARGLAAHTLDLGPDNPLFEASVS